MKIWIDTATCHWGEVSDGAIVIVDLTRQAEEDSAAGEVVDEFSLIAALDVMSAAEIAEYAEKYGERLDA